MRQTCIVLIGIGMLLSGMVNAASQPPFPRIATVNYSAPQNYDDPNFQTQLARYNIAMLSVWPGWNDGRSMTMQQSVQSIKSKNPQELVFLYISNNELNTNAAASASIIAKVNSMNWWLYPSGTSGTPVPSAFSGLTEVNNTMFTQPDSNGDRWIDWYAKFAVQNYYVPNPSIDGFFTDNVFNHPRVNGDWNLDGSTDSDTDPTVGQWYRNGYNHHFAVLNQLMPGKYQIGNVSDWGASGASLQGLSGVLQGGLMEAMIGYSYSSESWGGWQEMMREYRVVMAATIAPNLVVFGTVGSPTDYQTIRYGLASCLMDNGYYEFSQDSNQYSGTFWFDEFNANLGNATSNPPTSAWQNGVYRRDFDNGIALVNPKGNGTQTVKLETSFRRLSGTQDPITNNGQTVQTVTLSDRAGIILMRTSTSPPVTAQPQAPSAVTVH